MEFWSLAVEPSVEPVTLTVAKAHLDVFHDDNDEQIDALIVGARQTAEQYLGRGLVTQSWTLTLDDWPEQVWLPMAGPLASVTSVQYYASDGTLTALASTAYVVDTTSLPGRVVRAPSAVWPALQSDRQSGRIVITYVVGTAIGAVPVAIRQGLLLLVGQWFDQRAIVAAVPGTMALPWATEALWAPYRVWWRPPCYAE